jgi:hypothetical protein
MANITPQWKAWLRLNKLTKNDDNDYIAEPIPAGKTLHNEDVARLLVVERTEFKYDTLLSILNQRDRIVQTKLSECHPVQDNVMHMRPTIPGSWHGATAKFNPEVNRPGISVSETAETREIFSHIDVRIVGIQGSGAVIGLVTDVTTGLTDGTITPDGDIIIDGEKIKIAPEGEAGIGLFYKSVATETVFPTTHRFSQNDPKKVITRVPNLPPDDYVLYIVTRAVQGATVVKEQRTITYIKVLTVHKP